MYAKFENELSGFLSLITAIDRHEPTWKTLPAWGKYYPQFKTATAAIQADALKQARRSGIAEDKQALRGATCAAAAVIAAAVTSYAHDLGNHDLKKRADYSFTALLKGRDTFSATRCQGVLAAATEAGTGLADHLSGAPARLTDLSAKITAYQAVITSPADARKQAKAAAQSLEADFARARELLTEHLDKLILQFETTAPEFYQDYQNSRTPPSSAATHTTAEEPTPPTPTPPPPAA